MAPALPFWIVQRQVKAEPAEPNALRLTAPNLPAHAIAVRANGSGTWSAALYRLPKEGDKVTISESEAFTSEDAAWLAAFELYRQHVIV